MDLNYGISFEGGQGSQFNKNIYVAMMPYKYVRTRLAVFPDVQRALVKQKVNDIARYILNGLENPSQFPCFFTAITATAKGPIHYDPNTKRIHMDSDTPLSVNDGQHRREGIIKAMEIIQDRIRKMDPIRDRSLIMAEQEKYDKLESMCLPVVIFGNMEINDERQLFHDLNSLVSKVSDSVIQKYNQHDIYSKLTKQMAEAESLKRHGIEMNKDTTKDKLMALRTLREMICLMVSGKLNDNPTSRNKPVLNQENYEEWKIEVARAFDSLMATMPEDIHDRQKYIFANPVVLKGIALYINSLWANANMLNIWPDVVADLARINWAPDNPIWQEVGTLKEKGFTFGRHPEKSICSILFNQQKHLYPTSKAAAGI